MYFSLLILNPSESVDDMAAIVKVQKQAPLVSDEGFYGKGAKRKIPGETELSEHLTRKAKALLALKESMIEKLESMNSIIC